MRTGVSKKRHQKQNIQTGTGTFCKRVPSNGAALDVTDMRYDLICIAHFSIMLHECKVLVVLTWH